MFLVDSDNQTVFHLNQLGAAVWHLIAEPTAVDQIVAIVQQAFPDIAPEQVETDVTKLIDDLHSRGLINRKD